MCIIAYKPKNVAMPDMETLKNCFERNPDGAGIMIVRHGKVQIMKGYMTFSAFKKALAQVKVKTNEPAVFHFRIKTAGKITPAHCHPFPVTTNEKRLNATRVQAYAGLAHNGIISIEPKHEMSDTMTFIKYIFAKESVLKNRHDSAIQAMLTRFLGWSKIIILKADGRVEFLGAKSSEWRQHNGVMFSNETFKDDKVKQYIEDLFEKPRKTFVKNFVDTEPRVVASNQLDFSMPDFNEIAKHLCPSCGRATGTMVDEGLMECDWCGFVDTDGME